MTEYTPQGQPEPLEPSPQQGDHAVWRNVAFGALGLAALLAGAQIYQSNPHKEPDQVCNLRTGNGQILSGRVIRFLTPQQALALVERSQAHANGTIDPDYLTQQRAVLDIGKTVLVPHNMMVNIGDTVEFVGGHRAPHLPCHYIPNLISRVAVPAAG